MNAVMSIAARGVGVGLVDVVVVNTDSVSADNTDCVCSGAARTRSDLRISDGYIGGVDNLDAIASGRGDPQAGDHCSTLVADYNRA